MRTNEKSEVLVVGAGPVGMFTALQLAEKGIGVQLIDKESRPAGRSCACALHPRTLQWLDQIGLAREAIKSGYPIEKIAFYDGSTRRAELDLSKLPAKFPMVLVLEQRVMENLLEQKLQQAGVAIRWNQRLADLSIKSGGVTATIDELAMDGKGYIVPEFSMSVKKTASAQADFVVGADGQGSIVRQRLDIDYERAGKPELFVVYEFETESTLPPEIRIVLDEDTVSVLWPFGEHKGRWSFQWLPADKTSDFPTKDRSQVTIVEPAGPEDSRHRFVRLLRARAPWFMCDLKEVGWAADIQFEHRLARRFGHGRAWLAGDAAHQTGPVGMQSMNLGFREGADLAARLTQILRQQGSHELLETYDRERRAEWLELLGWQGALRTTETTDDWVRERAARIPSCVPATGTELTLLLAQLGLEFGSIPLPTSGLVAV